MAGRRLITKEEIVDELCPLCHSTRLIRFKWWDGSYTVECLSGCNYYREEQAKRAHTVLDCETCNDTGMALTCICGCGCGTDGMCPVKEVECYECGGRWPDGRWKGW
jgi:hypothetical protein